MINDLDIENPACQFAPFIDCDVEADGSNYENYTNDANIGPSCFHKFFVELVRNTGVFLL